MDHTGNEPGCYGSDIQIVFHFAKIFFQHKNAGSLTSTIQYMKPLLSAWPRLFLYIYHPYL